MAATKSHRYLSRADRRNSGDQFEFDEADVWSTDNTITLPEFTKKPISNPRPIRKPVRKPVNADHFAIGPKSLPVNIPDWSKILRGEFTRRTGDDFGDGVEDDDENDRMPPHEYLARTRVASFSVHEGVGRTLKGRDLSRVRNAIWKQTGFED